MNMKQERLKELYAHLRQYHGVHTQVDFANKVKMSCPAMSAAMNGNEKYLTKSLFMKICAAFPGVFNLDYLLNGTGTLLAQKVAEPTPVSPATDNILELHAQMIRRVDDLRQELHQEILAIRALKDELRTTIQELKSTTTYDYGMAAESH